MAVSREQDEQTAHDVFEVLVGLDGHCSKRSSQQSITAQNAVEGGNARSGNAGSSLTAANMTATTEEPQWKS